MLHEIHRIHNFFAFYLEPLLTFYIYLWNVDSRESNKYSIVELKMFAVSGGLFLNLDERYLVGSCRKL